MAKRWNSVTAEWESVPETDREREERLDQEADQRHREARLEEAKERAHRVVNPLGYL